MILVTFGAPSWPRLKKCVKKVLFWLSQILGTPKVGVRPEKFNIGIVAQNRNLVPDSTGIELFSLIDSRRCFRILYSPQTTTHSVRPARVHWMEQIVRSWGKISQFSDTKPVSHFSRTPSHWIDYVWPIRNIMSSLWEFDSIIVLGDIISPSCLLHLSFSQLLFLQNSEKGNF